jgi:serine/threonine protein kinase
VLGVGSLGRVSEVRKGDETMALKVVRREEMTKFGTKVAFFREIFTQLLAAHPCIVAVNGWNVFLGTRLSFSILMECYSAGTLTRRVPVLTPTQRSIIAYGIARAMRHLHSRFSITHRDLKPDNVLLDAQLRPLVADLGLAKVADTVKNSTVAGSVKYWAPEQLTADQRNPVYGLKVDVYAYGMIFYQLIESCEPKIPRELFGNRNTENRLIWTRAIAVDHLRPPTKIANPDQKVWLDRLWAHEAGHRPSFVQICAEFERGLHLWPDTDRAKFDDYRQWVDAEEAKIASSYRRADEGAVPMWAADVNDRLAVDRRMAFDIISSAIDGDHDAQKCAVMLYLTGTFVEQSFLLAARFALLTDDPAMAIVSRVPKVAGHLQRGELLEANGKIEEASEAYRAAAEAGSCRALWRWGALLVHNDVAYRVQDGLKLMEEAAARGVADAAFELGKMFLEGIDVIPDEATGVKWLERALELKHPDAALYLGRFYHGSFELEKARNYYELADQVVGEATRVDAERLPVGHAEAHELAKALNQWSS